MNEQVRAQIETSVKTHRVVLFMKGNRRFPQCGFSATVVSILNQLVDNYETHNVLEDPALREGIKEFSQWPTIPQLYIDGEFIGGCDIVKALHASGELAARLGVTVKPTAAPTITLAPAAAQAFAQAARQGGGGVVRMTASARFEYELFLGAAAADDVVVESSGLKLHVDPASAARLDGTTIEYVEGPHGSGFKITNPNEPPRVKPLTPAGLKSMLDAGDKLELLDVRTPEEQQLASIAAARLLDDDGRDYVLGLDRNTRLVFHCHHGIRSLHAAEYFLQQGFKDVYNLEGGIDAWSQTIDPSVRRY
jgi:monothiol glutaredoxin